MKDEALRKRRKKRRYNQAYYSKNKQRVKEHVYKKREESGYSKEWYETYGDWIRARMRLYRLCRPDLDREGRLRRIHPGTPAEVARFNPTKAAQLNSVYVRKLKKLRKLFNRDPDTGRLPRNG